MVIDWSDTLFILTLGDIVDAILTGIGLIVIICMAIKYAIEEIRR